MVRINIIRFVPPECCDCVVGFGAQVLWLAFNDAVLAEGLIPSRVDIEASVLSLDDCLKLSFALMSETIAHTHGEFFDDHLIPVVIGGFRN